MKLNFRYPALAPILAIVLTAALFLSPAARASAIAPANDFNNYYTFTLNAGQSDLQDITYVGQYADSSLGVGSGDSTSFNGSGGSVTFQSTDWHPTISNIMFGLTTDIAPNTGATSPAVFIDVNSAWAATNALGASWDSLFSGYGETESQVASDIASGDYTSFGVYLAENFQSALITLGSPTNPAPSTLVAFSDGTQIGTGSNWHTSVPEGGSTALYLLLALGTCIACFLFRIPSQLRLPA